MHRHQGHHTMLLCQQQEAGQRDTAQPLTETAAQQARVRQCIHVASVGDGMLIFQRNVDELEQRFTASWVPADHEDLLHFDDLIDEGSLDTSDGVHALHNT